MRNEEFNWMRSYSIEISSLLAPHSSLSPHETRHHRVPLAERQRVSTDRITIGRLERGQEARFLTHAVFLDARHFRAEELREADARAVGLVRATHRVAPGRAADAIDAITL